MICITEAQLRAAFLEIENGWRATPDKGQRINDYNAKPPEECADLQTEQMMKLLTKNGAKQSTE